jgi:hypothetical protein
MLRSCSSRFLLLLPSFFPSPSPPPPIFPPYFNTFLMPLTVCVHQY